MSKRRDELAIKFADRAFVCKHDPETARAGFKSGWNARDEEVKELREALETAEKVIISGRYYGAPVLGEGSASCIKIRAVLEKWKEK